MSVLIAPLAYAQPMEQSEICLTADELPLTRPGPSNQPTKVNVAIYIINIESINDIEQNFTIDFILNLRWQDPRLIHEAAKGNQLCSYRLEKVWNPELNIFNMRGIEGQLPNRVDVKPGGEVRYTQRFYGPLEAEMNLLYFPFDRQTLPISLVTFGHSPEQVALSFARDLSGRAETFSAMSWRISGGKASIEPYVAKAGHLAKTDYKISKFEYHFKAKRWINYYIWKVFTPLLLIVFMSWAVFWVSPLKMEVQVGLASTTILTLIAFLFSIGNLLPRISYLTVMDLFVFVCLIFVFLAFIESIITCSLGLNDQADRARRIDRIARVAFPFAFFTFISVFFVIIFIL